MTSCWCGSTGFLPFRADYGVCGACGTLVSLNGLPPEQLLVKDDEHDFYGKQYWLDHQAEDLNFPDIHARARGDLPERNLHWLKALLKYRLPPASVLELGCAHGSFVALLRQAGYAASGVEMSPWVVNFARETFGIPVEVGPVEALDIAPASLDAIALMDVLEHLPDPAATMARCLELLKPDGLLLIQTPEFKESIGYAALAEAHSPFLEQMKADEHLYLFSERSARALFQRLGAEHIAFEPAIFGHYDMFFAVSRAPLPENSAANIEAALLATPGGRLALALLDLDARLRGSAQTAADLRAELQAAEADRAARLEVIEQQGRELGKIGQLEADIDYLKELLRVAEADRAARLEVIEQQGREMGRLGAENRDLEAQARDLNSQLQALRGHWWHRAGKAIGTL